MKEVFNLLSAICNNSHCVTDDSVLQEEVLSIMQLVNSINAMAEELGRPVHLTTMLVSAEARGLERGRTEVNDRYFLRS